MLVQARTFTPLRYDCQLWFGCTSHEQQNISMPRLPAEESSNKKKVGKGKKEEKKRYAGKLESLKFCYVNMTSRKQDVMKSNLIKVR